MFQGPDAELVGEAVLPLGFKLLGIQSIFSGLQTVHRIGVRIVEQPLANQEVPDHYHGSGHQLADIGAQQIFGMLRYIGIVVHTIGGNPDNRVIHEQTDYSARHEDKDLHPARHVITMLEYEFHARQIVENQRDDERDGGSQHVVHVEYANQ